MNSVAASRIFPTHALSWDMDVYLCDKIEDYSALGSQDEES